MAACGTIQEQSCMLTCRDFRVGPCISIRTQVDGASQRAHACISGWGSMEPGPVETAVASARRPDSAAAVASLPGVVSSPSTCCDFTTGSRFDFSWPAPAPTPHTRSASVPFLTTTMVLYLCLTGKGRGLFWLTWGFSVCTKAIVWCTAGIDKLHQLSGDQQRGCHALSLLKAKS